ncbi:MAG: alpha/beta fold hydrolase [Leadbetterella sp.]
MSIKKSFLLLLLPFFTYAQINYGSNKGKYTTIRGTKMYYEEYGKGTPLLLIHGGLGDISAFKNIIPSLSKKYRVIIPDSPGLGRSDYADSTLSYALIADYHSQLIDKLKLDSVYITGWSDGAIVGLILAKKRLDKVKKLISVGANYTLQGYTKQGLIDSKNMADTNFVKTELRGWILHYQRLSSKNWTKYILEAGPMWLKETYFPKSDLESIRVPTLVIYGDKDMFTLEHGLEIKNAIPKSQFCVIPNCSHSVFADKPKLFLALAETFLRE